MDNRDISLDRSDNGGNSEHSEKANEIQMRKQTENKEKKSANFVQNENDDKNEYFYRKDDYNNINKNIPNDDNDSNCKSDFKDHQHETSTINNELFGSYVPVAPKSICIEGNIGCGKTTLLEHFRSRYGTVLSEPVDKWRDVHGENLFHYLYKDPKRYSLAFQTYVQLTMIKLHRQHPKLMERSIYSARYCFVENLYRLNYLSRLEYVILDQWFKYLVTGVDNTENVNLSEPKEINIDLIIYLRCRPENVMERIKLRSRPEEKGITFDYVNNIHQLHEDWLIHRKFPVPAPVLVLDTNCSQESLLELYEKAAPYISGEKLLRRGASTIFSLLKTIR